MGPGSQEYYLLTEIGLEGVLAMGPGSQEYCLLTGIGLEEVQCGTTGQSMIVAVFMSKLQKRDGELSE